MWYTIFDNISGIILEFGSEAECLSKLNYLKNRYEKGYDIRHNHVSGHPVSVIQQNNKYIMFYQEEL